VKRLFLHLDHTYKQEEPGTLIQRETGRKNKEEQNWYKQQCI